MSMRLFLLLTIVLLLSACAAPVQPQKRFFWPIGSSQPKIEYLKFFAADQDVRKPESAFAQAVLGIDPGVPLFSSPRGLDVHDSGKFMVADVGKQQIIICDYRTGAIRSLQDRDGEVVRFPMPIGVAFAADGGGYVSDTSSGSIYRFNSAEVVVAEFGKAELNRPNGLVFDSQRQRLYVADTLNHQLAVFDPAGNLLERIGTRGSGPGEFNFPLDVDLGPNGELVVLDALNSRVQVLDASGRFLRSFGERGTALGSFMMPKALAVDSLGHVYVTDALAHRFVIFDLAGNYLLTIGGRSVVVGGNVHPGGFDFPQGIATSGDGGIFVVDSLSRMVHNFQFLTDDYLKQRPVLEGDLYFPQSLGR
ncbi:MAG TPA: 6-bladed beta-propeller [Malonomonas sp.]